MKVIVGSTNPLKIKAVEKVMNKLLPEYTVKGVKTNSGVKDMPLSDDETINGAINRAHNSIKNADYGVGIEGGVHDTNHGMFLNAWVAVVNKERRLGLANTGKILLPENIASDLRQGRELGPLMDEVTGKQGVKHTTGTIGLLTQGLINRDESFENAILCAFMPLINDRFYK